MTVNYDKFKAIILTKTKQDTSGIQISLKGHCITSESSVSLLGVLIDCRLSFEKHVSDLCKTAASQLNALKTSPLYYPLKYSELLSIIPF